MATFKLDPWSQKKVAALIAKFEEFSFIDPDHVLCVRDVSSENARFYAATSLIPPKIWPLTHHRIIIQTNICNFIQGASKESRVLILKHELQHVAPGKEEGKYKLRHHDVEDFAAYLKEYGIGWASREDLPDILKGA